MINWVRVRGRVGRGAQDFKGSLEKHVVLFFSVPDMKK